MHLTVWLSSVFVILPIYASHAYVNVNVIIHFNKTEHNRRGQKNLKIKCKSATEKGRYRARAHAGKNEREHKFTK